jgi:hypothetical protein
MTDTRIPAPADVEDPVPDTPMTPATASPPPRNLVPWLYGIGFVVLAGAIFYLWQNPSAPPPSSAASDIQALGSQIQALQSRIDRLEQRPASDTAPLAARVAVLEQKAGGDTQLAGRVDALAGRIDALAGRVQASETTMTRRIDAETARVDAVEKTAGQMAGVADRANRVARVQAAELALAAGQPLGDIPGAPAALARFATTKPPTEASLRLAFPAAERAALDVSDPEVEGKPFLDRVLARTQELVTIRQGDHVIVGDSAAGLLTRARSALTAGDLPGAVAAVSELHGPPAGAMADWLGQAKALLEARAALATFGARA